MKILSIYVRDLSGTCMQDWNTNDNPQSTEVTQLHVTWSPISILNFQENSYTKQFNVMTIEWSCILEMMN